MNQVINHQNASALQALSVGVGTLLAALWPEHKTEIIEGVGALFTILGIVKPYLPPRVRQAFGG